MVFSYPIRRGNFIFVSNYKNLQTPLSITGLASISALGADEQEVWKNYQSGIPLFSQRQISGEAVWVSALSEETQRELTALADENSSYQRLDTTAQLAMLAARKAFPEHFKAFPNVGVNIGSSRGATSLFESYFREFQENGRVSTVTSPTTTLGNISSWVGQDLSINGPVISHSVTCSTALQAILNAIAWLESDMADAFVAGGSESPLTPFTIAQMKALKLYTRLEESHACESLKMDKHHNTMVLGEAAAVAVLEKGILPNAQALISGYGYASEILIHDVSISETAGCFQKSMRMALQKAGLDTVDAIVMHAPGTVKGDQAEWNAISAVFEDRLPLLTSNKWMIGHTLGASGMMSLEMAVRMLQYNHFIASPFYEQERNTVAPLNHIMINAVGFGGNAVSIIVSKS